MDESMAVPRIQPTSAIAKHIRRLHRNSPVRSVVERMIAGEELGEVSISLLILAVHERSGRKWRERTVAAWCLGECKLTPEQHERATSALRALLSDRRYKDKPARFGRAILRTGTFSTVLAAVLAALGRASVNNNPYEDFFFSAEFWTYIWFAASILFSVLLFVPAALISNARDETCLRNSMAEAATSLGKLADPFAVGALARFQNHHHAGLERAAQAAFPAVLESVTEEHYGFLPLDATPALCERLYRGDRWQAVHILRALGRAGDGRATGTVRWQLEASTTQIKWLRAGAGLEAEQAVLSAAEIVLPILEERLRQERAAERLLRPAQAPGAPEELLLRPAGSATSVPEEQLLRPVNSNDERE